MAEAEAPNRGKRSKGERKDREVRPLECAASKVSGDYVGFMPEITCPHCGDVVKVGFGCELDRVISCAACGGPLCNESFSRKARDIKRRCKRLSKRVDSLNALIGRVDAMSAPADGSRRRLLHALHPALANPQRMIISAAMGLISRRVADLELELRVTERSAYYASAWFRTTRIPVAPDCGTALAARFNKSGRLYLDSAGCPPADQGLPGEFRVFSDLMEECLNPQSPLFGCLVLPNLFFPAPTFSSWSRAPLWEQVDVVLLARECACIIEVKYWRADVFVDLEDGGLYIHRTSKGRGLGSKRRIRKIGGVPYIRLSSLDQNAAHAKAFRSACGRYSEDRLFEATLFVGPKSIEGGTSGFVANRYVGAFGKDDRGFISAFGEARRERKDVMPDEELRALARRLIVANGDFGQVRKLIHGALFELRRMES